MVLDIPSIDAPSGILGTVDDMWFRWVTDVGLPGPDRGEGGRYLMVGPGYDGPLPDSGYHVSHARTSIVTLIGRAFMIDNDPTVVAETVREGVRVYPYTAGAHGTAVASFLAGDAPLGATPPVPETPFVDVTGKSFNTIFPNDFGVLGAHRRARATGRHPGPATRSCWASSPPRHRPRPAVRP